VVCEYKNPTSVAFLSTSFHPSPSSLPCYIAMVIDIHQRATTNMHHMPSPFYDPPPYTYSTFAFEQLPFLAQKFLLERGLAPSWEYNTDVVENTRIEHAHKLFRTLEGVHIALVERRRELVALHEQEEHTEEPSEEVEERLAEIAHEVGNVLLPEWRSHLDDFMREFDALIWLDVVAREDTPDAPSLLEQQKYRNLKCDPIIQHAIDAVVALDEAVKKKDRLAKRAALGKGLRPRRTTNDSFSSPPREADPFGSPSRDADVCDSPPRNRNQGAKTCSSPPHGRAKSSGSLGRTSASWVMVYN